MLLEETNNLFHSEIFLVNVDQRYIEWDESLNWNSYCLFPYIQQMAHTLIPEFSFVVYIIFAPK